MDGMDLFEQIFIEHMIEAMASPGYVPTPENLRKIYRKARHEWEQQEKKRAELEDLDFKYLGRAFSGDEQQRLEALETLKDILEEKGSEYVKENADQIWNLAKASMELFDGPDK